jgi:hypothetical protein
MAEKKLVHVELNKLDEIKKIWYELQNIPEDISKSGRIVDYGKFNDAKDRLQKLNTESQTLLDQLTILQSNLEDNFAEIGITIPNEIQGRMNKVKAQLKSYNSNAEKVFNNGLAKIKPQYVMK